MTINFHTNIPIKNTHEHFDAICRGVAATKQTSHIERFSTIVHD